MVLKKLIPSITIFAIAACQNENDNKRFEPARDMPSVEEFNLAETESAKSICGSKGASTTYEHIKRVRIGKTNIETGNNNGYFSKHIGGELPVGKIEIDLEPGYTGYNFSEYWGVWVDSNMNNVFEPSEQILQAAGTGEVRSATSIPELTGSAGKVSVRIVMSYNGPVINPCGAYFWGETEDYTFDVAPKTCTGETCKSFWLVADGKNSFANLNFALSKLLAAGEIAHYRVAPGSHTPNTAAKACLKFHDTTSPALVESSHHDLLQLAALTAKKNEEAGIKENGISIDWSKDCMNY